MITQRVPAVPLITHDPYFSAWSPADALHEADTVHWCGTPHVMKGFIYVDGKQYRWMGAGSESTLKQIGLEITATSSVYSFEGAGIRFTCRFTSPLLLTDLELVSRPCTYVDFTVSSSDGAEHDVKIIFKMDESFCHNSNEPQPMTGGVHKLKNGQAAWMGLKKQTPLGHSGDGIRINWGYLYLYAGKDGSAEYDESRVKTCVEMGTVKGGTSAFIAAAYDDISSIQYFDTPRKALWAENRHVLEMLDEAVKQHDSIIARCNVFDEKMNSEAKQLVGEEYALICNLAYRQTIAAHKLISDKEGRVIFLSKENFSNGCIGTVDVSYPSTPLYLMYNPELVKGMIRPVLHFAKLPVWEYDYAPHDVGRYPYAWGQVYGTNAKKDQRFAQEEVYPPYYIFPEGSDVYNHKYQMPVEECGNMLIMIAAVIKRDPSAVDEFAHDMPLLEKWAAYLINYGDDPGEQLCTDDFAGHLAHNVNLSAKAIMGVAAFGLIKKAAGQCTEGDAFLSKAREMAQNWEGKFAGRKHTPLTFTDAETWGMKYNIVWDKIFNLGLFEESTYTREIECYLEKQQKYGLPLDNRKTYTKSDWILWCAAFADNSSDRAALIAPVYKFLRETPDRAPFSDWYDTVTAKRENFINRTVQGGLFMPLLMELCRKQ